MSTKKLESKIVEDSLGPVEIPVQAHWGCRTARWSEHSKQLEGRFQESVHPLLLDGLLQVFKAKLGLVRERERESGIQQSQLPQESEQAALARIKSQVCDEMLNGQWRQEIIVDPLLSQGGEAVLDNINEVVSGRSAEILGLTYETLIEKYKMRPLISADKTSADQKSADQKSAEKNGNDLELYGQDLFIAAAKLALITATRELSSALLDLERLLRRKSLELEKQLRELNREEEEQLIAAREFNNFGNAAERAMRRLTEARERLLELSLRGSRQSTDRAAMVRELTVNTGLKFKVGEETIGSGQVTGSLADLAGVASIIKELALDLIKVGQCLRRLDDIDCDPQSIASLLTNCFQVQGSELTISLALQSNLPPDGSPSIALATNTLLKSIDQLRAAVRNFNRYCIARVGLAAN